MPNDDTTRQSFPQSGNPGLVEWFTGTMGLPSDAPSGKSPNSAQHEVFGSAQMCWDNLVNRDLLRSDHTPIRVLPLSSQLLKWLQKCSVRTVSQLARLDFHDIGRLPDYRPEHMGELVPRLAAYVRLKEAVEAPTSGDDDTVVSTDLLHALSEHELDSVPLEVLQLRRSTVAQLTRLGVTSVGHLARLPASAFGSRSHIPARVSFYLRDMAARAMQRPAVASTTGAGAPGATTHKAGLRESPDTSYSQPSPAPDLRPLSELGFSQLECEKFAELGVLTAEGLAKLSDDQILNVGGVGQGTLAAVRKQLGARPPGESRLPGRRLTESISHLHLSVRTFHALKRAGVDTIGQLRQLGEAELMAIRGVGVTTVKEVQRRLRGHSPHGFLSDGEGISDSAIPFAPLSPNLIYDVAPLAVLELKRRYASILQHRVGVATVGQLARYTREELRAVHWVGAGMLTAVQGALAAWERVSSAEKQRRLLLQTATPVADTTRLGTSPAVQAAEPLPDTLGALVSQWLERLPARDRDIVCGRLGIGCAVETLQEIAQCLGLTRERVRQIQARSVRKMAAGRQKEGLRRFVLGVERLVEQMGGLTSAEELQRELPLAIPLGDLDAVGAARLLAETSDKLVWLRGERALALANVPYGSIDEVRRELRNIADGEPAELAVEDIITRYVNAHLFDEHPSPPDAFVRACLRTGVQMSGADGRASSGRARAGSRKERIRAALGALSEPSHYGVICTQVNAQLPEGQQMNERSVYSCLQLYSETFVRVGRGIYGLVEWRLPDDGSVANAVCRVLAEAGRPLSGKEITKRVLETWRVKDTTVQAALYADDRIVYLGEGMYTLGS